MKKIWKKVLASMLAVVMVLASLAYDWGNATEAEAAEETSTVEADFTKDTATVLDQNFQATQGTTDEERASAVADSVSEYWNTAKEQLESVDKKLVNVALEGTASFSGSKIGSGTINNGSLTDWVGMGFSTDATTDYTATIDFKDNAFYEISNVTIQWRDHSNDHFIPVKFEVQANNGSAWTTIATEDNCGTDALSWSVDLENPVMCSGIRIVSKEMRKTSSYAIIFSEIQTWGVACTNVALEGTESLSDNKIGSGSLIDGSTGDWVGMGFVTDATKACTATVDFKNGGFYEISNITIYWRNSSKDQFIPVQFEVQANNGREWVTIAAEDSYSTDDLSWSSTLNQAIVCSGVRVVAKEMSGSSSYAIIFSEIQAWGVARANAALNGTQSFSGTQIGSGSLTDGNTGGWVGMGFSADASTGYTATVNFENNDFYEISNVTIQWRDNSTEHYIPVQFEVQAYNGKEWVTIAEEDNCGTDALSWRASMEQPVICSSIQVVAKEMRGNSSYAIIFTELQAWGVAITNAALSGTESLSDSKIGSGSLNDGDMSNWVGMGFVTDATKACTATVNFKNNGFYEISKVMIHWRNNSTDHYIPVQFEVQAYDGTQWVTIAEEDNCGTDALVWSTTLIQPITCSGIQVVAKEMRGNSSYAIIFTELQAWGTKVTNYLTTKTSYNSETPISTLLTWTEKTVENFHAEIQMSYYDITQTKYALYYGQTDMTTLDGARSVSLRKPYGNHGAMVASGLKALPYIPEYTEEDVYDYVTPYDTSGAFNPSGDSWYMKDTIKNFPSSYDEDNIQTLNVEVLDGVVKMWWTGFEKAAWKAELADGYTGGYISLVSQGNNQGGFKSFKVRELTGEDIDVKVGINIEAAGNYTVVSLSGDLAGNILKSSDIEGSLKFDQSKFEYRQAIFDENHESANEDASFVAANGNIPMKLTSCKAGTIVKIYFKNLTDELDYTGFGLNIDKLSRANGKSATAVISESVTQDYTGDTKGVADKQIDIRDLVHASVNDKAPADVRDVLVGKENFEVEELVGDRLSDVYVNVAASDRGRGTETQPYNSIDLAYNRVKDGGTIHIVGAYGITAENNSIGVSGKAVTLTGGTLDLSGETIVQITGPVTLDGIAVTTGSNVIYANGNKFVVNSDVSFSGKIFAIFGGSTGSDVVISSTHLELYAGDYQLIYGGSEYGTIQNDTNLIVGGTVNTGYEDILDHGKSTTHNIFGGSSKGVVKGNTNVTIKDSAMTCIAYGGGNGSASKVEGICKLTIQGGSVMGYYGGSYYGEVAATEVVMTGGTAEQLFGGNWGSNVNGSTKVTWTGGEINRRIYGGCYNGSSAENTVVGTTELSIGGNANFSRSNSSFDYVISAGSMFTSSSNTEETSTLNMTEDRYSAYEKYVDNNVLGKTGYSDYKNFNWVQ